MTCPYMSAPWFALLRQRCEGAVQTHVARQLGISATTLNMVLNGTGPYGSGAAKTDRVADRVLHTFGRYPCPHLSAEAGEVQVISAEQCRAHAHRPPPATPRDVKHWQACRQCEHLDASAPPMPRAVQHRNVIPITPVTPHTQEARHV
ncbi:hypothetical protein SAMN04489707_1001166 [Paenacidovorax caeni]|uniref:Uncharacterized protein n=2 Tax=Paenacidovorax caeni TaxID=343013 RepID=A0A1I7F4G0_9BURK|nr:hypothetical protein SAMN04489707_1001166 [Paenacidovorax caeni]